MDRKWKFLFKGGKASFRFCFVFLWLEQGHMTAFRCKRSWVYGKGKMNWLEKIFTPNKSELCWHGGSVARCRVGMACCCWPVSTSGGQNLLLQQRYASFLPSQGQLQLWPVGSRSAGAGAAERRQHSIKAARASAEEGSECRPWSQIARVGVLSPSPEELHDLVKLPNPSGQIRTPPTS